MKETIKECMLLCAGILVMCIGLVMMFIKPTHPQGCIVFGCGLMIWVITPGGIKDK